MHGVTMCGCLGSVDVDPEGDQPAVMRGPHDDPSLTGEELIAQRTRWFEMYTAQGNVFADESGGPYPCPYCGHVTLSERGGYEICGECGWKDDGQDDHDVHVVRGGPNGRQSLAAARAAYVSEGGTPLQHRPPTDPA
jgi:cysteine-rich CPCC protein